MLQNIPHQIAQSPARLGLPNPNSPSLSNSTPPKPPSQTQQSHPSQQQSIFSNSPKVPPTLISLLPPLPRAQSLLLQMASLSSKLFEVSPKRSLWLTSFRGSLPTFLSSQNQSTNLTLPSTTKEITSLFSTLQTQLFESVAELQEILDLQDAKHKVVREIQSKDSSILSFANKLKEAEHVLDMLVDDYSDYRQPKRSKTSNSDDPSSITTVESKIKLSDILSYAHKISYTTFAPPGFGAGQGPLRGALPPAPQEEQLRASQLYHFADLDVGLPKTEKAKEKAMELIAVPPESSPHSDMTSITGLIPSNIIVPSGWKPGMPVELPSDFPILPPAGWKPGDPVHLPAFDSLGRVVEVQPAHPIGGARQGVVPRSNEPIQVPHVSLDILDQDDDSSDFSSSDESGSSEDNDD